MASPKTSNIPRASLLRLAVYLEVIEKLHHEGIAVISSEHIAKACSISAAQIRKDLTFFGEFGVRGVGYNTDKLLSSIADVLGVNRPWNCVLVGVGKLGHALLNHHDFSMRNYHIVGAFDCDEQRIGEEVAGITVQNVRCLKECAKKLRAAIGMIATPQAWAQQIAEQLADAGIRGILNFAPTRIFVPDHIFVEYADFFHNLYALSFNISMSDTENKK